MYEIHGPVSPIKDCGWHRYKSYHAQLIHWLTIVVCEALRLRVLLYATLRHVNAGSNQVAKSHSAKFSIQVELTGNLRRISTHL
jgi:hypothetical protein